MIQPLSEQQSCAKQLQLMTVSPLLYWFCHFLFDWFTYSVFVFFAMTVIENLQDDVFLADNIGIISSFSQIQLGLLSLLLISLPFFF